MACSDFTLTACVRSVMTWEKFGPFKMAMGRETARGCVARTWEEDGSV
jgi:hypothetical protein